MDSRNSGDSDSGVRPRGTTSAVSSSSGAVPEVSARGRSGTGFSLNEDDSGEVDSVCTCKVKRWNWNVHVCFNCIIFQVYYILFYFICYLLGYNTLNRVILKTTLREIPACILSSVIIIRISILLRNRTHLHVAYFCRVL